MSQIIKMLLVEDNKYDAELIVETVKRVGFNPQWQRVISREEYVDVLDESIDIIIADHTLPQFDAIAALKMRNERGLQIPFIIVSGTISENAAIEGLRLGATDYLIKDRLTRLGPAIKDAIEQYQLRKAKDATEEALLRSERQFRLLAENASDIIFRYQIQPQPAMDYISMAVEKITGYSVEEFYHDPELPFTITHPEDVKRFRNYIFKSPQTSKPQRLRWKRKNGRLIWLDLRVTPSKDDSYPATIIEGIARDITDLMELQEALQESEALFRGIVENMEEGFYRTSPQGKILLVNPQCANILGYEDPAELVGKSIFDLEHFANYPREEFERQFEETGEIRNFHSRWYRKDGTEIVVRENAHAVKDTQGQLQYYEGTVEDITEQQLVEEQLIQAQKVESLGQVAGGIAHDFNNALASLSGAFQMIEMQVGDEAKLKKYFNITRSSIEQAKSITNRLLTFTKSTKPDMKAVSLQHFIYEMKEIAAHTLPKDIQIDTQPFEGNDLVAINKSQLQQVVLNMCINAAHAMPGGGTITLGIRKPELDEIQGQLGKNTHHGYLCLVISDSGCGIESEIREKIFEPFFTTKGPGKGTGLGLAVSYKIIQNHNGWIEVDSEVGVGTTFQIGLPTSSEPLFQKYSRPEMRDVSGVGEHILLIDDEPEIREMLSEVLKTQGYEVTTANDGLTGLEIFRRSPQLFDLVLTDLGLPRMSGIEMTDHILSISPETPVIAATGYIEEQKEHLLENAGFKTVLRKPFDLRDVLYHIKQILSSKQKAELTEDN